MIRRRAEAEVLAALDRQAAVALLGPRQVGKTTLALAVARKRPAAYFDLEAPQDLAKFAVPELVFEQNAERLVILDEIHRAPRLFPILRGVIDAARRKGRRTGRFLLLGSASLDLVKRSGETLAGRIAYVEMTTLTAPETGAGPRARDRLWLRGGFPESYLSKSDAASFILRQDFIRSYLERDIPQFGPRIPAETMRRLWTMLAHNQGQIVNASRLAAGLDVSSPTVARYIDLLVDLLLVRRLQPFHSNAGKRLVKSPKVYIRDCGLVHALLRLETMNDVLGHPVAGASWEGFVLETLLAAAPDAEPSFYRTSAGAEIDLILDFGRRRGARSGLWSIEIKRSAAPKVGKGLRQALADLQPKKAFVVYAGEAVFPLSRSIEAIGLTDLAARLADRRP